MNLSAQALQAWRSFLEPHDNRGHLRRELAGATIDEHVAACYASSVSTAERMRVILEGRAPRRILEVGASTGLNCLALQRLFPEAEVIGIEPESEAIAAAVATAECWGSSRARFLQGFGESLPFEANSIDFILCHTVIEHVADTCKVIAEMARTLAPAGVISLEAPNYIWPKEPHLNIWCLPLLGKRFIKICARMQGRTPHEARFVDHLQLVHPGMLEHSFASAGLRWRDGVRDKIAAVAGGDLKQVRAYRSTAPVLRLLRRIGMLNGIANLIIRLGLHPSVMYTLTKA